MSGALRIEPGRAARVDEAGDEPLDAGVFDRAMTGAGDDDQAAVREEPAPAAEVRGGVEWIGTAGSVTTTTSRSIAWAHAIRCRIRTRRCL